MIAILSRWTTSVTRSPVNVNVGSIRTEEFATSVKSVFGTFQIVNGASVTVTQIPVTPKQEYVFPAGMPHSETAATGALRDTMEILG